MSDLASLLMQLSDIPGPSGFEHEVRKRMEMELTPYTDKFKINYLLKKSERDGTPRQNGNYTYKYTATEFA